MKQQIKSIKYDHQFDKETERWKNLTVPELQNIEQLKVACVIAAKEQRLDLDFGSLDANYDDLTEPQIQFNPEVDNIPEQS